MEKLDISKVEKVYSGKNNRCCCGCSGNYYYNSQHARDQHDRELVNDNMCRKVLKIVLANDPEFPDEASFRSCVIGNRLYIVYWV